MKSAFVVGLGRSISFKLLAALAFSVGVLGATGCASDIEDPVSNPGDEPQQAAPQTPFGGELRSPSDGTSIEVQPGDVGGGVFDVGGRQPGLKGPVPSFKN